MKRSTVFGLACVVLCLVSSLAAAGIKSPCDDPLVLPGPKVHVFIMPYEAQGKLSARGQ